MEIKYLHHYNIRCARKVRSYLNLFFKSVLPFPLPVVQYCYLQGWRNYLLELKYFQPQTRWTLIPALEEEKQVLNHLHCLYPENFLEFYKSQHQSLSIFKLSLIDYLSSLQFKMQNFFYKLQIIFHAKRLTMGSNIKCWIMKHPWRIKLKIRWNPLTKKGHWKVMYKMHTF